MFTLVKDRYGHFGANDYKVMNGEKFAGMLYREYTGKTRHFPNHLYLWSFASYDKRYVAQSWATFKDAKSAIIKWTEQS